MTKQIVLASGNMGKAREFGEILSPLGIEIHLQKWLELHGKRLNQGPSCRQI